MTDEELRQAILQYVKEYYERNKEAPPLRSILKHFRKEKLNFTRFYRIFPNGTPEACRLADVPAAADRLKMTQKAIQAVKERKKLNAATPTPTQDVPFSSVFYVDEDGQKHTLDEWSNGVCGDLLDLNNNIKDVIKKIEALEHGISDLLNAACPHCGGQMFFVAVCLNCKKTLLMQPCAPLEK
jgi:hypothetical protein